MQAQVCSISLSDFLTSHIIQLSSFRKSCSLKHQDDLCKSNHKGFPGGTGAKNPPANEELQEMWAQSPGQQDLLG